MSNKEIRNRPLSEHWADVAAFRLLRERFSAPDSEDSIITVASGITPSGTVHVGNFREVMSADLMVRALRSLGLEVRFLYSWDNFDAFRKVPANFPQNQEWSSFLGQKLSSVPDPWQKAESLSAGRMGAFEVELKKIGIDPQYLYQEDQYGSGVYGEALKKCLQERARLRVILNRHRTEPLDDLWWPLVCYCPHCGKNTTKLDYDGEWGVSSHCTSCGFVGQHDLRSSQHIKLTWRVDWPMRWAHEGVDLEPGGKDHSSRGGSYDTAQMIIKEVFGQKPPQYLPYDFVIIKGKGAKMSSSKGEVMTLSELMDVYEPQIIRWIFARSKPNHDFAIALDEDVFKVYEEFDREERIALSEPPTSGKLAKRYPLIKRTYELSQLTPQNSLSWIPRPPFRELCDRLQICALDPDRTLERFYPDYVSADKKREIFLARAYKARHWLTHYAPAQYVYQLRTEARKGDSLSALEREVLQALLALSSEYVLEDLEPGDLQSLLYEKVVRGVGGEPQEVFMIIYQALISRPKGPRLAGFLKELGSERVAEIIKLSLGDW